ncbi:unnamed protein product [Owenia fusiformis]|uniref:Metalloendopeptidase n=1 Tax=Owenia fusiformis TaxID=6347 RepID=A0A8S4PJP4_OWEFU|nr:unnamed protein product [Owenia fusiformis]
MKHLDKMVVWIRLILSLGIIVTAYGRSFEGQLSGDGPGSGTISEPRSKGHRRPDKPVGHNDLDDDDDPIDADKLITRLSDGRIKWTFSVLGEFHPDVTITCGNTSISRDFIMSESDWKHLVAIMRQVTSQRKLKDMVVVWRNMALVEFYSQLESGFTNHEVLFDVETKGLFQGDVILSVKQSRKLLKQAKNSRKKVKKQKIDFRNRKKNHRVNTKLKHKRDHRRDVSERESRETKVRRSISKIERQLNAKLNKKKIVKTRTKRKMRTTEKWTLPIPYFISKERNHFDDTDKDRIKLGISHWEQNTCIRFTEQTKKPNNYPFVPYVEFQPSTGCSAYVGRDPFSPSEISVHRNCLKLGTIAHEIGHILGFWHEHTRPDRDSYVKVVIDNIMDDLISNYNKWAMDESRSSGIPYDIASIMHYGKQFFSKFKNHNTLESLDPLMMDAMGQRTHLSFLDVKLANYEYCLDACPGYNSLAWNDCQNDGYRDPNSCTRCKCPDGWEGTFCDQVKSKEVCGENTLSATSDPQRFHSPGFPIPGYPKAALCTWLIQAPEGKNVITKFAGDRFVVAFEQTFPTTSTRSGTGDYYCEDDWVEVRYQSLTETGPRFCGFVVNTTMEFVSRGNKQMILFRSFHTDSYMTYAGFQMEYFTRDRVNGEATKQVKVSGIMTTEYKHYEGLYKIEARQVNGMAVFKHILDDLAYLFFVDLGKDFQGWGLGAEAGADYADIFIESTSDYPDKAKGTWISWVPPEEVLEDQLVVEASEESCEYIHFTNVNGADENNLQGVYELDHHQSGFPVYRKVTSDEDLYLYHINGDWLIGDTINSESAYAVAEGDDTVDPTKISIIWKIFEGGRMVLHNTAKIECHFGENIPTK